MPCVVFRMSRIFYDRGERSQKFAKVFVNQVGSYLCYGMSISLHYYVPELWLQNLIDICKIFANINTDMKTRFLQVACPKHILTILWPHCDLKIQNLLVWLNSILKYLQNDRLHDVFRIFVTFFSPCQDLVAALKNLHLALGCVVKWWKAHGLIQNIFRRTDRQTDNEYKEGLPTYLINVKYYYRDG